MALLVKKFGGTSVGSINKIKNIAKNISKSKDAGHDIVIVVSAMGQSTDDLNNLAYSLSKTPPEESWICFFLQGNKLPLLYSPSHLMNTEFQLSQ